MKKQSIILHLDKLWYDALSRQMAKEDSTVEEKLDEYLDELINRLPKRVYDRVCRKMWDESEESEEKQALQFRAIGDGKQ